MKVHVATTTKFHLARLASELANWGEEVAYTSYVPDLRLRREVTAAVSARSLFRPLLPHSAFALMRGMPWQSNAVEAMLERTDSCTARFVSPSDFFVGLSSMSIESANAARGLGATVIIERGSRHVLSQDRLLAGRGRGLNPRYIKRELASYEVADFISVLSEHSAASFVDEGFPRERLFVSPLGVDFQRFRPSPRPPGPPRLLFVGSWSFQKGADVLARAVRKRPDWQLTHVGMKGDIDFPPPGSRFRSVGHQDHTRLAALMAEHHVLVLPSRQDGFGMVLLEALAAGLPVVASRMTGGPDIRAVVSDPRWVELVEPGDYTDLLRGLDTILGGGGQRGPAVRVRLSECDRAFFSWSGYGERYHKFLTGLYQSGEV